MEQKLCKKCRRTLPEGYKHKCCESCRNKQAQKIKDGCKGVMGIAVMIGATAVAIKTKDKINTDKE